MTVGVQEGARDHLSLIERGPSTIEPGQAQAALKRTKKTMGLSGVITDAKMKIRGESRRESPWRSRRESDRERSRPHSGCRLPSVDAIDCTRAMKHCLGDFNRGAVDNFLMLADSTSIASI